LSVPAHNYIVSQNNEGDEMSKGLANIMKQAQMIQQKMAKLQEEAKLKTATATSGGGAVSVIVNGKNEIISLVIKKEAVDPNDVEMLQDLVITAVNEALKMVHAEMGDEMSKITGGMNIPGLF
jgi:DNA-binding YbaB/EbfC family protein